MGSDGRLRKPLHDGQAVFVFGNPLAQGRGILFPNGGKEYAGTVLGGKADPDVVRGFGLGLLFVPINNAAYGSLEPQEAQQAAGLINLARQLGGSFGIAVLVNYVSKHTQFHRADLVSDLVQSFESKVLKFFER